MRCGPNSLTHPPTNAAGRYLLVTSPTSYLLPPALPPPNLFVIQSNPIQSRNSIYPPTKQLSLSSGLNHQSCAPSIFLGKAHTMVLSYCPTRSTSPHPPFWTLPPSELPERRNRAVNYARRNRSLINQPEPLLSPPHPHSCRAAARYGGGERMERRSGLCSAEGFALFPTF